MDYEKKYKEALSRAKELMSRCVNNRDYKTIIYRAEDIQSIFPELKESEDERIRKELTKFLKSASGGFLDTAIQCKTFGKWATWLEKQGKETSWKPSKEEMDVLYSLAYITNKYDEHKDEVITRLYQDLKREFFNGSSYENMFPNTEDGVRRRSTIQVLEYARSLDNYNQYGKAYIDKNIAWLEKQGKKPQGKSALEAINEEKVDNQNCVKPTDKVEPKFHEGEWLTENHPNLYNDELNRKAVLYDAFLEKACEYLRTHLWQNVDDDNDPIVESVHNITLDNFIKDFKRYLEE